MDCTCMSNMGRTKKTSKSKSKCLICKGQCSPFSADMCRARATCAKKQCSEFVQCSECEYSEVNLRDYSSLFASISSHANTE